MNDRSHPFLALSSKLAVLALAAFPIAGCTLSEPPRTEIRTALYSAAIYGDLKITQGGQPGSGTRMELVEDLDLEPGDLGNLAADVDFGPVRIGLEWLPLRFEGREELDEGVVFRGTTFPEDTRLETELELETFRLRLDTPIFERDGAILRGGLGLYYWDLDIELEDHDTGFEDDRQFSRLLPSVMFSGEMPVARDFSVAFDAAFAAIDQGRILWDFETRGRMRVARWVSMFAGFRFLRYQLNEDTNDGTIDVFGPILGFDWRF